jgi:squalene-associated FAD-dependent desaturase
MQPIESDVIVVGGGLAGLASAVALSDAGLRVTVLEAQKALGGRARSWRHAPSGDVVDTAAQVIHSEQRNLLRLVERLGTGGRIAWLPGLATLATAPRPTTLQHRRWPLPLSLVPDLARMPGLSWLDLLSSLRAVCRSLRYTERDAGDLDAVSGREWLQRCGVAPAAVDLLWRPLAASALYAPLEQCSAAALARVHAMLLGERQLHFGVPRVGLSDLYVAPAVAAIEHAGGRVLSGAPVMRLVPSEAGHRVMLKGGTELAARHVVLAVPPYELDQLVPGLVDLAYFPPSSATRILLWFDRPLTKERLWFAPWGENRLNCCFQDLSNARSALSGRDAVIAGTMIDSERLAIFSDQELVSMTINEIAEFAPRAQRAQLVHREVLRLPLAVSRPVPGSERHRPPAVTRLPRVFLAGDWTRTRLPGSLDSAARSGALAAERVLEAVGRPRQLAVSPHLPGSVPRRRTEARGPHPSWRREPV